MRNEAFDPKLIAEEVSQGLASGTTRNSAVFITTPIHYPNGTAVVVRIDKSRGGYTVSDDGYTAFMAETMHMGGSFTKIAADIAKKTGLSFEKRTIYVEQIERAQLVGATSALANAVFKISERIAISVEQMRAKRSHDMFDSRLLEAFGSRVVFGVAVRGATNREWDFDAGVTDDGVMTALFTLVAPAFTAVATANMKITDVRSISEPPAVTVALMDYEHTEPALRSILAVAADRVIAANDDVERYRLLG